MIRGHPDHSQWLHILAKLAPKRTHYFMTQHRSFSKHISLILGLAVASVSLSTYSFWLDEAISNAYYSISDFSMLLELFFHHPTAEAQQPLYFFILWVWTKFLGNSEITSRFANILFLSIPFIFIIFFMQSRARKIILLLLILLHPFIWYNLNEARSTILFFSISMTSFLICESFIDHMKLQKLVVNKYRHMFLLLSFFGVLSHTLYFFTLLTQVTYLIISLYMQLPNRTVLPLIKPYTRELLLLALFLLPLFGYQINVHFYSFGRFQSPPGVLNLSTVIYEFLGFGGLGPPRNLMRAQKEVRLLLNYLPTIIPLVLSQFAVILLFLFIERDSEDRKKFLSAILTIIIILIVFLLYSVLLNFGFWGRHTVFVLPMILFMFAISIEKLWKNRYGKPVIILIFLMLLFSSLNQRFNPEYQKEDYKTAIKTGIQKAENSKKQLFITGDEITSSFYGIYPLNGIYLGSAKIIPNWDYKHDAIFLNNLTPNKAFSTNKLLRKDIVYIIFKKYDVHDAFGIAKKFVEANQAYVTLDSQSYTIIEK